MGFLASSEHTRSFQWGRKSGNLTAALLQPDFETKMGEVWQRCHRVTTFFNGSILQIARGRKFVVVLYVKMCCMGFVSAISKISITFFSSTSLAGLSLAQWHRFHSEFKWRFPPNTISTTQWLKGNEVCCYAWRIWSHCPISHDGLGKLIISDHMFSSPTLFIVTLLIDENKTRRWIICQSSVTLCTFLLIIGGMHRRGDGHRVNCGLRN